MLNNGAMMRLYDGYVVVTWNDGALVAATRQVFDTFENALKELNRHRESLKNANPNRKFDILCFGDSHKVEPYDLVGQATEHWMEYSGACPDEGCSGGCVQGWCDNCGEDYLEKIE